MSKHTFYFFVVSRQLHEMLDIVDGEEDAIAPHGTGAVCTALAAERATQQFYHKTQGKAFMGNYASQWQDGAWRVSSEVVGFGRWVAL